MKKRCEWKVGCLNVFMIFSDNKRNVNYTYIHPSPLVHTRLQHTHPKPSLSKHPTADP